jgi:hypothetical protein
VRLALALMCAASVCAQMPMGSTQASSGSGGGVFSEVGAGSSCLGATGLQSCTTTGFNTTGADLYIVTVGTYLADATTVTVSDTQSFTWTPGTNCNPGGNGNEVAIWYSQGGAGTGSHTVTVTPPAGGGGYIAVTFTAWKGSTASPLDRQNCAGTMGATSVQPGSITPSVNGELIVTAANAGNASTSWSVNSGFTIGPTVCGNSGSQQSAMAYLIQATAAAVNPTPSSLNPCSSGSAVSVTQNAAIASFKP